MKAQMTEALDNLIDAIVADYSRFIGNARHSVDLFHAGLDYTVGRKYIKITKTCGQQISVWGFIVAKDTDKFRAGDILKAAGWATPATNTARGNILENDFSWVQWTGPQYI